MTCQLKASLVYSHSKSISIVHIHIYSHSKFISWTLGHNWLLLVTISPLWSDLDLFVELWCPLWCVGNQHNWLFTAISLC